MSKTDIPQEFAWITVGAPVFYHAVIGQQPTMETWVRESPWLMGDSWVAMVKDKAGAVACAALTPRGILNTEPIIWKDPDVIPPPDNTVPGQVLIGWIFCHVGREFWSALHRRNGRWMMSPETEVPSHTKVIAYADPPKGPGSGLRQHGAAS